MDGVNVGHTRCNVSQCTTALASSRHRFCPVHQHLNAVCAVQACEEPIESGFRTCPFPSHRTHEIASQDVARKAIFRLRARLRGSIQNSSGSAPVQSLPLPEAGAASQGLHISNSIPSAESAVIDSEPTSFISWPASRLYL